MTRRLVLSAALVGALALAACTDDAVSDASQAAGSAGSEAGSASSQGGSSGSVPDEASGAPTTAGAADTGGAAGAAGADGACDAAAVSELDIFSPSWDPLGYPPYAVDACTLVYVAAESGGGALRRRDLATGVDTLLESAASHPSRPTVRAGVIAWERDGSNGREVSVLTTAPAARTRSFEQAGEPRATSDAVVFTQFLGLADSDDTDVMLYDVTTDEVAPVASGAAQQRFADVSESHVAFSDFVEDPQGHFRASGSLSDIVIVERASGERTVRGAPGKQAFPLLGQEGVVVYLAWGAVHPEPKFSQFLLRAGHIGEPVSADFDVKPGGELVSTNPAYVRPSLHGRFLDFVDSPNDIAQLYRVVLAKGAQPTPVAIVGAPVLFGPAAAASFTLVAKLVDQKLKLLAISR